MTNSDTVYFAHIAGSGVPVGKHDRVHRMEIAGIHFVVLSPDEIERMSVVRVCIPETTAGVPHSLSDLRMGPIYGQTDVCQTCSMDYQSCPGHFGHIVLPMPVYNPMFIGTVVKLLNTLCVHCCRMRMSHVWVRLTHPAPAQQHHHATLNRLRLLSQTASRQGICVHCCRALGSFRLAPNRLAIEYQPTLSSTVWVTVPVVLVHHILMSVPDTDVRHLGLDPVLNHPVSMIMLYFPVLPPVARPSTRSQRYTSSQDHQGTIECEDDLTRELRTVVTLCNQCDATPIHLTNDEIENRCDDIQAAIERIVLDAHKGATTTRRKGSGKVQSRFTTDSVRKRWAGKIGRVRREVMGKRVNFCARTVVTCDSSIAVDEIGVPYAVLQRITVPCPVAAYNMQAITRCMHQGRVMFLTRGGITRHISFIAQQTIVLEPTDSVVRGSARYAVYHGQRLPLLPPASASMGPVLHIPMKLEGSNQRLTLLAEDIIVRSGQRISPLKTIVWPQLRIGDVVLVNPGTGDTVLFNRQPTLVEESMLGMRIHALPIRSFACTCAPMEAMRGDYDGDEVNLHFPQGPHSSAEVDGLLGIQHQIVTGQSSRPVVRLIHDAVVGCFWLTCSEPTGLRVLHSHMWNQVAANSFLTVGEISSRRARNLLEWQKYVAEHVALHGTVPFGAAEWPKSGLALLSLFLPESMEYLAPQISSTMQLLHRYHPTTVGRLQVRNGIVVKGVCDSTTLNGRDGIIRHIHKYHGSSQACDFLSNIQVVTAYLTYVGFNNSIGMDDCRLPRHLEQWCHQSVIATAQASLYEAERMHHVESPYIQHQPLFEALLQVRRKCEPVILRWALRRPPSAVVSMSTHLNQFALLTVLGTKGSMSNMMQTVQSLGQQVIEGTEVDQNWTRRTLPHEVPQGAWADLQRHRSTSVFSSTVEPMPAAESATEAARRRLDHAQARGLVLSSFVGGLDPMEFFWHAAAGREALVEGATSTASSGYAMRLCMKMSEHDTSCYDGTIRDHNKNIIMTTYGADGMDGKHVINVPGYGPQFADLRVVSRLLMGHRGVVPTGR